MKIVSQCREQAKRVYYGAVFKIKKEIPVKIRTSCFLGLLLIMGSLSAAQQRLPSPSRPCPAPPAKAVIDWVEAGFVPCHTGFNPYEFVLSPSTVGNLNLRWKYTAGDAIVSSPAVVNGVVYVGSFDRNVYALNATTGAILWTYTTGGEVWSSPAVVNGVVYIGSTDNNVYALDARTGARLWQYPTGFYVYSAPAVVDGVVYIGSGDKNLYALNASTGVPAVEVRDRGPCRS